MYVRVEHHERNEATLFTYGLTYFNKTNYIQLNYALPLDNFLETYYRFFTRFIFSKMLSVSTKNS